MVKGSENKIASFLKDHENFSLVLIILLASVIRLYYFFTTSGQALWWDEAEYMSTAIHWAFDVPYDLNPQRPPLFQLLASFLLKINLGEQTIKFFLVIIPSISLVFSIYLLGKEMYSKRIGLIAALFAAFSWSFVFWSSRFQPDFLSITFQVLSILFMWKFWKLKSNKLVCYAGIFAALGFYFKVSALLVPLTFAVFILFKDRLESFKEKGNYLFLISYLATLVPYFIWSYVNFGTFTAFRQGYSDSINAVVPFGWYNLKFFYGLTDTLLFFIFVLGLIFSLKFLVYFDLILKDKKRAFNQDIFSILVLVIVSAFYIFYIRGTEDRWVFLWLPFIYFISAKAIESIYLFISKKSKVISIIIISILIFLICYSQAYHFNSLINDRKSSYLQVKEAGIWLNQNSNPEDKVLSASYTQSVYYSKLNVTSYSSVKGDFDNYLEQNRPRYLQVSIYEQHPEWLFEWLDSNNDRLTPLRQYFIQQGDQKMTSLVIYEVKYG